MYRVSITKLKMIYLSFIIYDLIFERNKKLEHIFLPHGSEYGRYHLLVVPSFTWEIYQIERNLESNSSSLCRLFYIYMMAHGTIFKRNMKSSFLAMPWTKIEEDKKPTKQQQNTQENSQYTGLSLWRFYSHKNIIFAADIPSKMENFHHHCEWDMLNNSNTARLLWKQQQTIQIHAT